LERKFKIVKKFFLLILCGFLYCGCAQESALSPDLDDDEDIADYDPLEPVNRVVFEFNGYVDGLVLKPLANVYRDALPTQVQDGVHNALKNLWSPVTVVNCILQLKPVEALETTLRFVINTIFGLLGIFDVATEMGIPVHDEDLGKTLAVWGAAEGPYLVLPILGPSNLRDTAGIIGDYFVDPYNYLARHQWGDKYMQIRFAAWAISLRARHEDTISSIEKTSFDHYATVRSMAQQYRRAKVNKSVQRDYVEVDTSTEAEDDGTKYFFTA